MTALLSMLSFASVATCTAGAATISLREFCVSAVMSTIAKRFEPSSVTACALGTNAVTRSPDDAAMTAPERATVRVKVVKGVLGG
ncbi:hypothetical protein GCM10023198_34060 [Promicromonospora umidemergens]|uniref:Secreted protein n=1 Tax=Promicromonospora umidemergens TaxID=629679 RepID=A0ABP8XLQ7_9MICO